MARDKVCDKALPQAGAVDPRLTARQAQGEIKTKFATKFGWVCVRIVTWFRKRDSCEHPPKVNIPVFLISNSTLHWKRQIAHGVWFSIRKTGRDGGVVDSCRRL